MCADPMLHDIILAEFVAAEPGPSAVPAAIAQLQEELGASAYRLRVYRAQSEPRYTLYFQDLAPALTYERIAASALAILGPFAHSPVEVSRLKAVRRYPGASPDAVARFHYVVRTDIEPGSEQELERWYDEEHMPSLAAVPGAVLAQRLVSLDSAPRYYACYDLVSDTVLQSPAWLAVRNTAWSGRVRPKFRNTRRIIFHQLPDMQIAQRTIS